jgi:excisionase family DNA binding protein
MTGNPARRERMSGKKQVVSVDRIYLSYEELAAYVGISVRTLRALVKDAGLPYYRIGKLHKFRRDDFDQWAATRKESGSRIDRLVDEIVRETRRARKA